MIDPAGNRWTNSYDLLGRQIVATDPDKGTTTSSYDDAGQLTATTDALGKVLWHVYDQLGRRTQLREDSPTGTLRAAWTYDTLAKGQLTSSTRYDGAAQYMTAVTGYDNGYRPLGQKVTLPSAGVPVGEEAIAGTYTTSYTYTVDGQLKTLKHPSTGGLGAETVTTHYDAVSVPSWMTGGLGWGVYVAGSDWSAYGQPTLLDLGNSYFYQLSLDYETGTNRLANTKLLRQGAPGYDLDATYTYDDAGNVTSITNQPAGQPVDAQCYRFDALRRLTDAWTPFSADCAPDPTVSALGGPAPYWTSYSFDQVGNRLTETRHATGGDTTRAYSYPTAGGTHPHAVTSINETGPGGPKADSYGYDLAGNTTARTLAGQPAQTLVYDNEGRLSSVTANGQTSSYVYTADGDRLLRRENGVTTVYLPGGQELRLTVATGAKAAQRYYSFAGRTVAVRTASGLSGVTTLVADHHGTAELSITNTTNVLTRRRHDPYGNPRGPVPSWPSDHGFLDKPKDTTGLTHIGARQYDPLIGRFISVDALMDLTDPQQWHGYAYANNNPTTWTDPSGLAPVGDNDGNMKATATYQNGQTTWTYDPEPPSPTADLPKPPSACARALDGGACGDYLSTGIAPSSPRNINGPYELAAMWLTGMGSRNQVFMNPDDPFIKGLMEGDHIPGLVSILRYLYRTGQLTPESSWMAQRFDRRTPRDPLGVAGALISDGLGVATFGYVGTAPAEAILGSYQLFYAVTDITDEGEAEIYFQFRNQTGNRSLFNYTGKDCGCNVEGNLPTGTITQSAQWATTVDLSKPPSLFMLAWFDRHGVPELAG